MPETADNTDRPQRPGRLWYRLHVSTCVVLVLVAAVLTLVVVPGDLRHPLEDASSPVWRCYAGDWPEPSRHHGWPLTYLCRETIDLPEPTAIPWLQRENWPFAGRQRQFSLGKLAVDIAVALSILALVAAAFESRRRRRDNALQFRLRGLFALFFVIAAMLGWWQMHRQRSRHEVQAVDAIYDHHIVDCSPVVRAYYGPVWLRKLVPTEYLDVFNTFVSVDLRISGGNTGLQQLREHLDCLPNLRSIGIHHWGDSNLTDAGLAHLSGLAELELLTLPSRDIHGEGLKYVYNSEKLAYLNLSGTSVSDAALVHLEGLNHLRYLDLSGTRVTDDGSKHLASLDTLRELNLARTQVTEAGLSGLRRALPDCKIRCE